MPSYIPLTAADLTNWVTGSARSYAASGVTAGHVELIDPATGAAIAITDGATGELVLTHLMHRAAPLLRCCR